MKLDYNKVISQKMDDYDDDEYKKLKELFALVTLGWCRIDKNKIDHA